MQIILGEATSIINIVSGFPRSGTSMMMRMLNVGGVPAFEEHEIRHPDQFNPYGYYESIEEGWLSMGEASWLTEVQDMCVKIMPTHLKFLPPDYYYKVLFMTRHLEEVLASQRNMAGDTRDVREEDIDNHERLMAEVFLYIKGHPSFSSVTIDYNDMIVNPRRQIGKVSAFLGKELDTEKMIDVVDPDLYRFRAEEIEVTKNEAILPFD